MGKFNFIFTKCTDFGILNIDKRKPKENSMKKIGDSNYFIDTEGNVFNNRGRELAKITDNGGIGVRITLNGKRSGYPIWKLMKDAYFSDMKEDEIINIIDGNITNTKLENYEVLRIDEIGKRIEGFEDYIITKDAKVYSVKYGRLQQMATYYAKNGYEMIKLCKNNVTTSKLIHRLVALAFIPNPENKEEIDHINADIKDNTYTNLRWATRKENMNYCFERTSNVRNYKECILTDGEGLKKEFKSKTECCRYAEKELGCSYSSLMKYGQNGKYRIEVPQTTIERVL